MEFSVGEFYLLPLIILVFFQKVEFTNKLVLGFYFGGEYRLTLLKRENKRLSQHQLNPQNVVKALCLFPMKRPERVEYISLWTIQKGLLSCNQNYEVFSGKKYFVPGWGWLGLRKVVSNDLKLPWYLLEEMAQFPEGSVFWADSLCLFSSVHYLWQVMKYSVRFDTEKVEIFPKGLALQGWDCCTPYEFTQTVSCVQTEIGNQAHPHVCTHALCHTTIYTPNFVTLCF